MTAEARPGNDRKIVPEGEPLELMAGSQDTLIDEVSPSLGGIYVWAVVRWFLPCFCPPVQGETPA